MIVKGYKVEILDPKYNNKKTEESLEVLLSNHYYNTNTDWNHPRWKSRGKKVNKEEK